MARPGRRAVADAGSGLTYPAGHGRVGGAGHPRRRDRGRDRRDAPGPGGARSARRRARARSATPFRLPSGLLDAEDRTLERAAPPLRAPAGRPRGGLRRAALHLRRPRPLPLAAADAGLRDARQLSIAYLALVRESRPSAGAAWVDWYDLYPWEDHRCGPARGARRHGRAGGAGLDRRRPRRRRAGLPRGAGHGRLRPRRRRLGRGAGAGALRAALRAGPAGRVARPEPPGRPRRSACRCSSTIAASSPPRSAGCGAS